MSREQQDGELAQAVADAGDAARVLREAGLHPAAVTELEKAQRAGSAALQWSYRRIDDVQQAIEANERARAELIES